MSRRIPLVTIALIAATAHEVNRAYCAALGDHSQPAWADAPEWQQKSAFLGVHLHLSNEHGPEASHQAWMQQKLDEGWLWGPEKDPEAKRHPCLVPFDGLSVEQKAKDFLFRGVVHSLSRPASAADDAIMGIETVDQFADMLVRWHGPRVASLNHLLDIPPGTEVELGIQGEMETVKLEGTTLIGFKAGIITALGELGELPFVGSVEDPEAEADQVPHDDAAPGN